LDKFGSSGEGMSYYFVIRGPLGVGKTTISRALARSIRAAVVSIDEIADKEWDGGSVRLYVRANRVAAMRARRSLVAGIPVVFDGCFYWRTQIKDIERRLPFPHEVITLRAPVSVCIRRDSGRKVVHGAEAAEQVYRKVTRFEYGVPVNATQDLATIVREIRSLRPLGGSRFRAS
jgi:predicted kinase